MLGTPWKHRERGRIRVEHQVGVSFITEASDGRCVKSNAVLKGARKLTRHNGNILLFAVNIAKRKTDKLHVLLLYVLHNFLFRVLHFTTSFFP